MPRSAKLSEVLTLAEVQLLTDTKMFARGKAYFNDGAVSRLDVRDDLVRATVRGTHRYRVELAVDNGGLAYRCNCPVGDDGVFCKHAVAVALSWLENSGEEVFHADEPAPGKPCKKRKTYAEVIREYVATLGRDALEELLMDAVEQDLALRDKLLFAARSAGATDLPAMKIAVSQMTGISRPLDWQESGAYADGLMSLADMLRQRLSGPHAAQVVELCELAIAGAEKSLEQIDDSNGDVMPAILELASVHLDACKITGPDPVKLAERLFRFQTEGRWDTFYNVLPAYAEPLGKSGLRRYRELVNEAWEAMPILAPGKQYRRSYDSPRMQLEHAMAALAELDGDVDALIRIHSKDLSSPYRFLVVAELCVKHGRPDDGLAWAERGILESGQSLDQRLLDFCIDAYLRRGEFDKAASYAWQRFEMRPTADAFPALMEVATVTDRSAETRERALKHLWALVRAEEATAKSKRPVGQRGARTELVRIFLASNENDVAWETFTGGPVATQLWPEMAYARSKTHPHDAIALYHRLLPAAVERGTYNARYDEAFEFVQAIGKLRARQDERSTFAAELEEIRAAYRAKRNFMKRLAKLS
ncbi:putative Zn finger protein [Paraburkholderia bannensis]|uniref:Putative Zn finger protein n=1 Tax=Paraburkholderia bannensis TaxID=765414 RepID=A0A7W9TTK9_9BURK|nr:MULTISPECIES: DUF6880 family protein [Paraburkholderia]MBB3255999.1 putative Zn finger protein [Paraburkholderia sp. WP4_3_2]MBB6100999.1 putative Zn finger protein [Paraburkholderia bannensis]